MAVSPVLANLDVSEILSRDASALLHLPSIRAPIPDVEPMPRAASKAIVLSATVHRAIHLETLVLNASPISIVLLIYNQIFMIR